MSEDFDERFYKDGIWLTAVEPFHFTDKTARYTARSMRRLRKSAANLDVGPHSIMGVAMQQPYLPRLLIFPIVLALVAAICRINVTFILESRYQMLAFWAVALFYEARERRLPKPLRLVRLLLSIALVTAAVIGVKIHLEGVPWWISMDFSKNR